MQKIDYAERARALTGVRFRPQGRDAHGLDCVGVILLTFGIAVDAVRRDYRLSGGGLDELREQLSLHFRRVPRTHLQQGDVMLLEAGDGQLHLAVRTGDGFVQAHAGIRRVVETPGLPHWPLLGVYRKRARR